MQTWAYATFSRGANLTGGLLSQSKVQEQPLGALADNSEGQWLSPLHTTTAEIRTKKRCPSIDCRGDGNRRRPVVKQLVVCVDATAPRNYPIGRQRGGREVRPRLAWRVMHDPRISRPPYLLIKTWS